MSNTQLLFSFVVATVAATSFGAADACESRYVRVSSYVKQPPARVAYATRVVYRPAATIKPAVYEAAPDVKKTEPVVVAAAVESAPAGAEIEVDSTVTASLNFLGADQGHVFLQFGAASLECKVVSWSANSVTFKTPNLGLRTPTTAKLEVVRPDGQIVRGFKVRLAPKANLMVHAPPAPVLSMATDEAASTHESTPLVEAPAAPLAEAATTVLR